MDSIFDDIDWFTGQTEDASEVTMEVGDDYTQPEDASSQDVPIPQFLDTEEVERGQWGILKQPLNSQRLAYNDPKKPSPNPWPPKLVFDLALGLYSQEEVLLSNGISDVQFERLMEMPTFRQELAAQMREQQENGVTYQRKAAIQAETYLLDLDDMVRDKEIAASTRLATIQYVTKVGGLEPKESKGDQGSTATQVNLQINFT
jgi:hypothetical protein